MTWPEIPDSRKCKAKSKRSGKPCARWSIPGGDVCSIHGGKAPQVRAAAQRRLATREIAADVEAVLAHEGITAIEDPLDELGKLASSSKALMDALGARVNSLEDLSEYDERRSASIKAEVQMYERAMDRTHRLLDSLVKHGYLERQIQIQEAEAMLVAGVLRRVIAGLGLTPEQQSNAQSLLAHEFRALAPRPVAG